MELPPRLEELPKSLERRKKERKSGRMVAKEQAAMPMPVSDIDQIATSVVAYKKSAWLARSLTYGIRIMVAIDALWRQVLVE